MGRASIRQQWKAKLEGKEVASRASPWEAKQGGSFEGQVLGIDPSLRGTGLSLIEFKRGKSPIMLRCQTVTMKPKVPQVDCLGEIFKSVTLFLDDFPVDHVALEQTIYVQNFQTAIILGAARGAAIAAVAIQDKPIFEYAPLRVKQAVVGVGRASKEQMAKTVMSHLGHGRVLAFDEADAAGVALCHAFTWKG